MSSGSISSATSTEIPEDLKGKIRPDIAQKVVEAEERLKKAGILGKMKE